MSTPEHVFPQAAPVDVVALQVHDYCAHRERVDAVEPAPQRRPPGSDPAPVDLVPLHVDDECAHRERVDAVVSAPPRRPSAPAAPVDLVALHIRPDCADRELVDPVGAAPAFNALPSDDTVALQVPEDCANGARVDSVEPGPLPGPPTPSSAPFDLIPLLVYVDCADRELVADVVFFAPLPGTPAPEPIDFPPLTAYSDFEMRFAAELERRRDETLATSQGPCPADDAPEDGLDDDLVELGILALGLEEGLPVVYQRDVRAILRIAPKKESLLRLGLNRALALGCTFDPKTLKEHLDVEAAFEKLRYACEVKGLYRHGDVRGAGLWSDNGKPFLHAGDDLVVTSRHVYIPDGVGYVSRAAHPLAVEDAGILFRALEDAWGPDAAIVMTGWLVCAIAGGALAWRPHVWVTAPRGAGKTTLIDLCQFVLGRAAVVADGSTSAAGLRQKLRHAAKAVILDECEPETMRDGGSGLLTLIRGSSSGTEVLRGTVDGSGHQYVVRSPFLLASVKPMVGTAADQSRIVPVELAKVEGSVAPRLTQKWLANAGAAILTRILEDWNGLQGAIGACKAELLEQGRDAREQDTLGTLLGASRWLAGRPLSLSERPTRHLRERMDADDAQAVLERILQVRIARTGLSLGQTLMDQSDERSDSAALAEATGVRLMKRQGGETRLFVAASNHALQRELAPLGSWAPMLMRIPGAESGTARMCGVTSKGVFLPYPGGAS